ncbi:asparaginyl-tRNA synthetase [Ascodesmis nigricans]|uniref:asparagine--tRNA ligase n=1 Tax=Ascodesmis nigricans TaxID=341454 RepID=A0A4S2N7C2_9PEZI|nr:asparaginyl-tRNA synthetase [Ascodesmis nigricans]
MARTFSTCFLAQPRHALQSSRFSTSFKQLQPTGTGSTTTTSELPRTIASLLGNTEPSIGNAKSAQQPAKNDIIAISGWIRSLRKMGMVAFAHVSDGSTSTPLQVVLSKSQAIGLTTGTSVEVTGLWKPSLPGTKQKNEVQAQVVRVLGGADPETYPLQKKYQSPEFLRSLPHLRPRIPFASTLLRVRSATSSSLTRFFEQREFVQVYPPIITSSDCEGGGETFTVGVGSSLPPSATEGEPATTATPAPTPSSTAPSHFFKSPKYLTVSSQLHLEALAAALPRVWTLSPTFRAEKSDTNRHLSEFYMLEVEVSFIETLDPLLDLIEDMIKSVVGELRNSAPGRELLALASTPSGKGSDQGKGDTASPPIDLEARWDVLSPSLSRWTRITYTTAIELLTAAQSAGKTTFAFPPTWGSGLQSEHEKYLAQHFNGPVFVTNYPRSIKPFYMLRVPGEETVACFDLLLPGVGELIGGSLREHEYERLLEGMREHGLLPEGGSVDDAGLKWYTELRKWGSVPHGGFGLGMDRLLVYLAGLENVRESSTFPRWVGRCDC